MKKSKFSPSQITRILKEFDGVKALSDSAPLRLYLHCVFIGQPNTKSKCQIICF